MKSTHTSSIQVPKLVTKLSLVAGIAFACAFTQAANAALPPSATGTASASLLAGSTTSLNNTYNASTTAALGTVAGTSIDFATFATSNPANNGNNSTITFNHQSGGTIINDSIAKVGSGTLTAFGLSDNNLSFTGATPIVADPAYQGDAYNNNGSGGVPIGSGVQFTLSLGAVNNALLNVYTIAYSSTGPQGQLIVSDANGTLWDSGTTTLPTTSANHTGGYFAVNLSNVANDTITVQYLNAGTQGSYNNLGIQAASIIAVPEPSTFVLAGIFGFGMLMLFRRRRA